MATKQSTKTQTKQPQQDLPDAFALFKPSWQAFKLNIDSFVLQFLFPLGMCLLAALLAGIASQSDSIVADILTIAAIVGCVITTLVVVASLTITSLHSAEGKVLPFEQAVRAGLSYAWRMLALLVLCALVICVGFLLFIVPGVFAVQRLLLAPYFLVGQDAKVTEAIRLGWRAGKAYSSPVWGVVGILLAINLIGIIPWVGWVVAAALNIAYLCAPALRYVQILRIAPKMDKAKN